MQPLSYAKLLIFYDTVVVTVTGSMKRMDERNPFHITVSRTISNLTDPSRTLTGREGGMENARTCRPGCKQICW